MPEPSELCCCAQFANFREVMMRSLMGEGDTCPYLLLRVRPYAAISASLPSYCRTLHADFPTCLSWYA